MTCNCNARDCADVTDQRSAHTEITYDGRVRFASHYYGCKKMPKRIGALAHAIDSIVGTTKWVVPDAVLHPTPASDGAK